MNITGICFLDRCAQFFRFFLTLLLYLYSGACYALAIITTALRMHVRQSPSQNVLKTCSV